MKVKIKNLGMNGEGVAENYGKILFIPNCLPDEEVECEVVEDKKNYAICKLTKVLTLSPERAEPPCKYYNVCGGCDLQHMSKSTQLKFKQQLIHNTLKKVAKIDIDVLPTIAADEQYFYRNKISLSVCGNKIGFKAKSSDEIVDICECMIANKEINFAVKVLREFLSQNNIKSLRNIVIRNLESQTLIAMVCKQRENLTGLFNHLNNKLKNFGLFLVINKRNDSVVLTNNIYKIGGLTEISLTTPIKMNLRLESFYQTNQFVQDKLYDHILKQISEKEIVVNGYSGAGLLSAILAQKAKMVYGIEINKSAHLDAENLKKSNKIVNLSNVCGDFFENLKKIKKFNTVILDPSKKGCGEQVMQKLIGVDKIIYVSCNPIALAKDLRVLDGKYKTTSVQPFDMFPNTINVETCVCLEKI